MVCLRPCTLPGLPHRTGCGKLQVGRGGTPTTNNADGATKHWETTPQRNIICGSSTPVAGQQEDGCPSANDEHDLQTKQPPMPPARVQRTKYGQDARGHSKRAKRPMPALGQAMRNQDLRRDTHMEFGGTKRVELPADRLQEFQRKHTCTHQGDVHCCESLHAHLGHPAMQ